MRNKRSPVKKRLVDLLAKPSLPPLLERYVAGFDGDRSRAARAVSEPCLVAFPRHFAEPPVFPWSVERDREPILAWRRPMSLVEFLEQRVDDPRRHRSTVPVELHRIVKLLSPAPEGWILLDGIPLARFASDEDIERFVETSADALPSEEPWESEPDEWPPAYNIGGNLAAFNEWGESEDGWEDTVVAARYGGQIEGGRWLCFPLQPQEMSPEAFAERETATEFWLRDGAPSPWTSGVGRGDTPQRAAEDALRRRARRDRRAEPKPGERLLVDPGRIGRWGGGEESEERLRNPQVDFASPKGVPWPVTMVQARYSGTYEGGEFLAFPLEPYDLPRAYDSDDVTAMWFWREGDIGDWRESETTRYVGRGGNRDDALGDLLKRLRARR